MGTPMECPPPSTRETVGILRDAIISAMASPASTSPPTVFKRIRSPSISSSSSMRASFGSTCSYLVAFAVRRRGFMAFDLPDHRQKLHFMLPGISIEHCLPGFPDLLVLARFPVQFLLFSLFVLIFP